MNLTNLQSKLIGGKWMLTRSAFDSLYTNLCGLNKSTYGGLKSLILGNPIQLQSISDSATTESTNESIGDLACLNISGVIVKGASEEEEQLLGVINIDRISRMLDELAMDDTVGSIIINFNTPGGEVTGTPELAQKISDIDKHIKPVYGWTETQCASAGYWLASQCRTLGMTRSAELGSIGVYLLINDETKKLENEGVKVNAIYSGLWKLLGHSFRTLSDEERNHLQTDVTKQHEEFKAVVKAARPEIKDEALEGLSYSGDKAFDLGLTDVVCGSIEEYINEIYS